MGKNPFRIVRRTGGTYVAASSRYEYYRVHAVERALDILKLYSVEQHELCLADIAQKLGVHKSTAHRLVRTLERAGFLTRNSNTGAYGLGLKLVELGAVVLNNLELRRQARLHLERLHRDTQQTVHLAILDDGEVVYVDKIEGNTPVRLYSQVGRRAPAHCTALGKVLLAHLPPNAAREILIRKGMRRYTPDTIVSVSELMQHLVTVRERGYALDLVEHEPLVHCVAAPIRDYTGRVVAALSVTLIAARVPEEEIARHVALVKRTAAAISADMGWVAPSDAGGARPDESHDLVGMDGCRARPA